MANLRSQFFALLAQTSNSPQAFEVIGAKGSYLIHASGQEYLDLISGFSVNNIGYGQERVIQEMQHQLQSYLHTNVYGEHIQAYQIKLSALLLSQLPSSFEKIFYLNSGSEAVELAIKLSKRYTGKSEIVVCRNGYHGSTHLCESLRSDEEHSMKFRPLVPGIRFMDFGDTQTLSQIHENTAAVIMEPMQTEAGIRIADNQYFLELQTRCKQFKSLLIFDEIQTGIGRTGSLCYFQQTGIVPDILLLGKALGAGMPLAAVIASGDLLDCMTDLPALGYITTFGGHPMSCAAAYVGLQFILDLKLMEEVNDKVEYFISKINHPDIIEIRCAGFLIALEFRNEACVLACFERLKEYHILVDGFLFYKTALRIAPALIITKSELDRVAEVINLEK